MKWKRIWEGVAIGAAGLIAACAAPGSGERYVPVAPTVEHTMLRQTWSVPPGEPAGYVREKVFTYDGRVHAQGNTVRTDARVRTAPDTVWAHEWSASPRERLETWRARPRGPVDLFSGNYLFWDDLELVWTSSRDRCLPAVRVLYRRTGRRSGEFIEFRRAADVVAVLRAEAAAQRARQSSNE